MFWCLPEDSKCEWRKLKSFVKHYNGHLGTNYKLSECLDVFNRKEPQPEIKLVAEGEIDIVIEHKIIVWPPNYLQLHRAQHEFSNCFIENVSSEFQDDVYVLEVNANDIIPRKKTIQKWAKQISNSVRKNSDQIRRDGNACSHHPINWNFKRLSEGERDNDTPLKGVGVHINCSSDSDFFNNFALESQRIKEEIKSMLSSHLQKASEKFKNYDNCTKIFITEVYGEHFLSHELIGELIHIAELPKNIDQIWVGYPEFINENEFETAYICLK